MAVSLRRTKVKDPRTGKEHDGAGVISLRPRLARLVPKNAQFEGELTDEGILFRFVGMKEESEKGRKRQQRPAWTRKRGPRKQPQQGEGLLTVALTPDELKMLDEKVMANGSR